MPGLTDEEDTHFMALAQKDGIVEINPHVQEILRVDFPLLRQQKMHLAEIVAESNDISEDQRTSIDGVLGLLDALMDNTVAAGFVSEEEVFGEENQ